jgi:hypothetical protein
MFGTTGHFHIEDDMVDGGGGSLRARVDLTLIDIYGRGHKMLPFGFVYLSDIQGWYAEPCMEEIGGSQ